MFTDLFTYTRSYVYKGHVIRDTFLRLVKFVRKIRDRLVLGIIFMAILVTFTLKLLENEAEFWDMTIQNSGKNWDRLV